MFKKHEIPSIIAISIILAFAITLVQTKESFLYILLSVFIIVLINILAKKIVAYQVDSEIETKIWEIERWGLSGILLTKGVMHPAKKFKKPIPLGAFLPLISKAILFPITNLVWMASLTFDVKTKIYKAAKRRTRYSFSEITDYQIGLIAGAGILANLIFAGIGYIIGLPGEMDFVRLSVFYAFFNMLPISKLDGNRLFFGNQIMYYTLGILTLAAMGYALFLI